MGQVRYSKQGQQSLNNILELRIPLDIAAVLVPPSDGILDDSKSAELDPESKKPRVDDNNNNSSSSSGTSGSNNNNTDLFVPFEQCLGSFFAAETVDLFNPTMQQIVPCLKTTRFKTFPRYLMVKLGKCSACFFVSIALFIILFCFLLFSSSIQAATMWAPTGCK